MTETNSVPVQESPEDRLVAELAQFVSDKVRSGEPVDLEALLAAHPQQADRLRRLLPTIQALAGLESDARRDENDGSVEQAAPVPSGGMIGEYQLVCEIGRGGMGIVYEALQVSLSRRVALKVLPFAAALDSRALARFKQESLAAAQLDHPHIVHVYNVGLERGVHYYAMQHIEGQSLAQVIAEMNGAAGDADPADSKSASPELVRGTSSRLNADAETVAFKKAPLSTDWNSNRPEYYRGVARLAIQAAEALDYAHEHGIVHRDIKPGNLLLDEAGKLYITDFGLARVENETNLTRTGDLMGTLRYMSPEQVTADRGLVDQRSDIYSLGATLYELLTLKPVFDASNRAAFLKMIVEDEPVPPRTIERSIPADLETILLKCLEKEPQRRYATAQALADDLQRYLEQRPVFAKPASLPTRIAKWSRRHQAAVLALTAVLAVSTLCLAISTVWIDRERSAANAAENQRSQEARRAEANLQNAVETVRKLLTSVSEDKLMTTPRATPLRRQLLQDAGAQLESLCDGQQNAQLLLQTAMAFGEIGKIHVHVAEFETAIERLARAKYFLTASIAASPEQTATVQAEVELSVISFQRATAEWNLGRLPEAEKTVAEGITALRRLPRDQMTMEHTSLLAASLRLRGQVRLSQFRLPEANQDLGDAIQLVRILAVGLEYNDRRRAKLRLDECQTLIDIGILRSQEGNLDGGIGALREAASIADAIIEDDARGHGDRPDLIKGFDPVRYPLPFSRQARWSGAHARMRLARLLVKLNGDDKAAARAEYELAIILIEPVAEEFPDVFWTHSLLLSSVAGLASVTPGDGAKPLWDRAVRVWREFIVNSKRSYESNELAWMMLVSDLSDELAGRAVEIAQHAVDAGPNSGNLNTLGVALYRVGRYADAIEALLKSEENAVQSSAYNDVFLAMAHFHLGNRDEARRSFDKAVASMDKNAPPNQELQRFRAEAAELLGICESPPSPQSDEGSTVE